MVDFAGATLLVTCFVTVLHASGPCLICLIAQTEQPPLLNVRTVQKEEEDEDEDESVSGSGEIDGEE